MQRENNDTGYWIVNIDSELIRARGIIVNNLLYGKTSLRQIRALWLVLSRSGFCSTDRFMETVQAVYFCFGAKPANSKFATKTAKKLWILLFFIAKPTRKSWKDCRIFTEISKMDEEDEHSPREVSIILNIWKLWCRSSVKKASTKARRSKTILSTNRKVQTA